MGEQWGPTAVTALLVAFGTLAGGFGSWLASGGINTWIKFSEHRQKLKEAREELRLKEKKALAEIEALKTPTKFSTEQIWEDTELGTGYKAMLYEWEKRVRQLEADQIGLRAELTKCHQSHASATSKAEAAENRAKEAEHRNMRLERKVALLERRAGIANNGTIDLGDTPQESS